MNRLRSLQQPSGFRRPYWVSSLRAIVAAVLTWLVASPASAATLTQTFTLQQGWNAVWLEVEPRDAQGQLQTADQVFNSPDFNIDQVAAQSLPVGTAEFSTDPSKLYGQAGWIVWSRTPASGESGTVTVIGRRAYLLHVSATTGATTPGAPAGTLALTGNVRFHRPTWVRGGYNFTGFSVQGRPTFGSLLRAGVADFVPTTIGSPIQKMNPATGLWEDVAPSDPVESGRAYWISVPFDLVALHYGGPVSVDFPGATLGGLDFGATPPSVVVPNPLAQTGTLSLNPAELTLSSLEPSGRPSRTVTLTKVTAASDQDLRLFRVERVPDQLAWRTDGQGVLTSWTIGALAPGESRTVTLGMDRNWTSGGNVREQLYRIDVALDGGSVSYHLPVSAVNADVPPVDQPVANAASFSGLWLGTVTVTDVISLTETNRPIRPVSSSAQLRLLIHVGTNGSPVLLAQAMRMQTKTADPSVLPQEVLILDESQIPYFEGIEQRGGKKVGIRYETVTFDMPRNNSTNAQSATFLQSVATWKGYGSDLSRVTDADVAGYLEIQETRPTTLNEVYHRSWPLTGTLGPSSTVSTPAGAPLRLDAYHRTNPFRHAYHPQHGAGYSLTRALTLQFDADYRPGSGQLSGTYEEVTTGLAQRSLVARGRIVLQRVSRVEALR